MRVLAAVLALSALLAGVASAAGGEKEQIHLNAADQAAARRAVAKRSDLGSVNWQGGPTKPDLSAAPTCPDFHPKQRDLVVTGAAASKWSYAGIEVDTQAQVLRTPAMVRSDWQRTVVAPPAIPCLRSLYLKQLGAGAAFVSFRRVLFPPVATLSRAYVLLIDVKTKTGKVRVAIETVLVGHGRSELTINSTAPNVTQRVIAQADAQLARALVARAV